MLSDDAISAIESRRGQVVIYREGKSPITTGDLLDRYLSGERAEVVVRALWAMSGKATKGGDKKTDQIG